MQLDNMDDVKELLNEINNLFMNLDNVKSRLEKEIVVKEGEQEDYLHELELSKLKGLEMTNVAKSLTRVRRERRILKNKLEFIRTLKIYADKFITKGIVAETKQVIANIENIKNIQETREYSPRVVKNLKCANKNK